MLLFGGLEYDLRTISSDGMVSCRCTASRFAKATNLNVVMVLGSSLLKLSSVSYRSMPPNVCAASSRVACWFSGHSSLFDFLQTLQLLAKQKWLCPASLLLTSKVR